MEKCLDYIQRIRDNAHRMNNIIESLLLFASVRRLDEVDVETIDMAAVVSEALERLAFMITQYEAEIIVPDVWPAAQGYGMGELHQQRAQIRRETTTRRTGRRPQAGAKHGSLPSPAAPRVTAWGYRSHTGSSKGWAAR